MESDTVECTQTIRADGPRDARGHYDIVYRLGHREATPPRWLNRVAGGWDGRVLTCYAAAVPAAAGALRGIAFVGEAIAGWATYERSEQPDVCEYEEDAG